VGLASVEDEAGIPADAIDTGRFEVEVNGVRYPARASVRPLYDPDRRRILA
jgi:4-methylaminobutanoate oxidase (formaldehyde-forming)